MSLADTAASGTAKLFGAQAVRVAVQIVSVVVLSRLLAPSDFGLVAMVAAVANIATVIGDFGLSAAAIQSQTISHQQRSNLFWTNFGLGVVLTAGVALLGYPLAAFYGHDEIVGITQLTSIAFLCSAIGAQFRAEMSKDLRFGKLAIVDMLAPVVALAVAVAGALVGWGYWALAVQPVILAFATMVAAIAVARWWPSWPRRAPMKGLYLFGAGTLGVQLATYISTNIDDVLVGRFWGATAAGFYSRAFQLFRLPMQQIAVPVARVALPILARIQDDRARFEAFVLRGQLMLAYTFGGIFYLLAAISDPLIDIALGPGWDAAKPIFLALAVGGVFQSITTGYWWVFQAKGLVGYLLRFSLMGRSAMVAFLFIGLPWGAVGVAWASAGGQALLWILYTAFAIKRAEVSRRKLVVQAATPVTAGTIAMGIGLLVSGLTNGLSTFVQLVSILGAFALTIAVFYCLVPKLREDLRVVIVTALRGWNRKARTN